jgi:hypothetical protein
MDAILPENDDDLRHAVRTNGESGFLFVNNHSRGIKMQEHTEIEFNIELKSGNVVIPFEKIPTGAAFFVPS